MISLPEKKLSSPISQEQAMYSWTQQNRRHLLDLEIPRYLRATFVLGNICIRNVVCKITVTV